MIRRCLVGVARRQRRPGRASARSALRGLGSGSSLLPHAVTLAGPGSAASRPTASASACTSADDRPDRAIEYLWHIEGVPLKPKGPESIRGLRAALPYGSREVRSPMASPPCPPRFRGSMFSRFASLGSRVASGRLLEASANIDGTSAMSRKILIARWIETLASGERRPSGGPLTQRCPEAESLRKTSTRR